MLDLTGTGVTPLLELTRGMVVLRVLLFLLFFVCCYFCRLFIVVVLVVVSCCLLFVDYYCFVTSYLYLSVSLLFGHVCCKFIFYYLLIICFILCLYLCYSAAVRFNLSSIVALHTISRYHIKLIM